MDDRRLTQQFRRFRDCRDADALAEVFDALAPGLLKVARHLTRDRSLAEDLLQTTFLTAMEKAETFDDGRPLRPWLAGILINHARHLQRKQARPLDPDRLRPVEERDPSELAEERELQDEVARALESLPEKYRCVLVPRLEQDAPGKEIARRMGANPGVIRMQIHRGLHLLKRALPHSLLTALFGFLWSRSALAAVRTQVLAKASGSAPASIASTLLVGGMVMSKNTILILAGAVLLVSSSLWFFLEDESHQSEAQPPSSVAGSTAGTGPAGVVVDSLEESSAEQVEPILPADKGAVISVASHERLFPGQVLDPLGRPVPDVSISLANREMEPVKSDARGAFEITYDNRYTQTPVVALPHVLIRHGREAEGEKLLLVVTRTLDAGGTVIDEAGSPLAGVTIEAAALPLIDFPHVLDRTVTMESGTGKVGTDEQGRFRFDHLPEGCAKLLFKKTGYSVLSLPVDQALTGRRSFILHARKEAMHTLRGWVTDHLSHRVAHARVGLGSQQVRTDRWGEFALEFDWNEVPPEGWKIYAAKAGYQTRVIPGFGSDRGEFNSEPEGFNSDREDFNRSHLEIVLAGPALEISGRLLDGEGAPLEGAVLMLWQEKYVTGEFYAEDLALPEEHKAPEAYSWAGKASGVSDESGAFRISGLSDRTYRFRVYMQQEGFAWTTPPIAGGSRNVELQLPADAFREKLCGRVVNRLGEPMADLSVSAHMLVREMIEGNRSSTSRRDVASIRSREDGSFEFRRLCRLDTVEIQVSGEEIMSHSIMIPPDGPDGDILLEVEQRCHFRIELTDPESVDRFYLLDEEGEELKIHRFTSNGSTSSNHMGFLEGKTEILTASDRAATLLLVGALDQRIPIQLTPKEVTVIRH